MNFKKIEKDETFPIIYEDCFIKNGTYYAVFFDKGQKTNYSQPLGNAVYVTKKLINLDDFKQFFLLKFLDSNGYLYDNLCFSRKKINLKEILELADFGVMVDEVKAKFLVHTLLNQEQNENLPVEYVHRNLGFKIIDEKMFFLGDKGYNVPSMYQGNLKIKPCGQYNVWKKMIKEEVVGHVPLETIFSIAVGGIIKDYLKDDIDVSNVFAHLIGESSSGKSTAGLLAVSLGASPNICDNSFVFTCNSTQNAIMNSISNSYPVLLDEGNQLFGDKTAFMYAIADGRERDRLSKDLERRETNTFNTSIFLTSEKSIIDTCEQTTGLRVRIIEFVNIPWTKSADSSDRIKSVIKNNYGFAIPKIAKTLILDKKNDFLDWYLKQCDFVLETMKTKGQHNDFSKRLSKIYALVICGAVLSCDIFGFDFDCDKILDFLLENNSLKDEETADIGLRAYSCIVEYVETHSCNFPKVLKKFHSNVRDNFEANYNKVEGIRKDNDVYIIESAFNRILQCSGFPEPKVVLKKLKQHEILIPESSDRYKCRFCLPNSQTKIAGYRIKILK